MKKSSEKSFGVIFSILFFLIGLWPLLSLSPIRIWSVSLAIIFLVLAFVYSKILKPLNHSWIKLGEIFGRVIAPIIMALVFFIIVTPISFLVRVLGKDLLKLKFSNKSSYWIRREKDITTMNKQF
jgi:hypothetical protein